ncbi:hypothetical protein GCM10007216_06800 [Thalassobacillus devorans]|uniref:Fur-regulated basic protein A n=1 Tax=Thalassobacillus devorans TaxID=279813 RepID=A0ABQ1NJK6_9BACI|nr:hypothetical protein [Thalassobacillus devorans]NIK27591.1 hypothetical protein [Thalassobacillus devorans]GGC78931.1 hypothetical protein GCM10007216_06800 [Thalassobacillus devorans]
MKRTDIMGRNELRDGVEKVKKYYIDSLLEAGIFYEHDSDPASLPLSELENMFRMLGSLK